jgi:hypothetical protein
MFDALKAIAADPFVRELVSSMGGKVLVDTVTHRAPSQIVEGKDLGKR